MPGRGEGAFTAADLQRALPELSRETIERLEAHRALLAAWSPRINLIGPGELAQYWRRHALDCAQLVRHAGGARVWVDFGSGAGFPGLVVAACLAGRPGAQVLLVESNHKKAAFLREAARAMAVPATIAARRLEAVSAEEGRCEVVSARAFAPLSRIISHAMPYLERGAVGLFLKGSDYRSELADAAKTWALRVDARESLSDPNGRILRVEGAERVAIA